MIGIMNLFIVMLFRITISQNVEEFYESFYNYTSFRYVQLPQDEVDTQLLQDAARKEAAQNKQ